MAFPPQPDESSPHLPTLFDTFNIFLNDLAIK
jgi:hypothetical protein